MNLRDSVSAKVATNRLFEIRRAEEFTIRSVDMRTVSQRIDDAGVARLPHSWRDDSQSSMPQRQIGF